MQIGLGIKVAVITVLMFLLLVPLQMIHGVISERSNYRYNVEQDIADSWTGSQLLVGPVLLLPYQIEYDEQIWNKETKEYESQTKLRWQTAHFIPEYLSINANVITEKRWRGIYGVPVYTGEFAIEGGFSVTLIREMQNGTQGFKQWGLPKLGVHIQDVRGIGVNPTLFWNEEERKFHPGTGLPNLASGIHAVLPKLGDDDLDQLDFKLQLNLRGSRRLLMAPTAKDVVTNVRSPWLHPKFSGRFLPVKREITEQGFDAQWQVSSFSSSVLQNLDTCMIENCNALTGMSFGVEFIETVDVYQKVTRAAKYGILFVLLSFVAFFLTETLLKNPLHPVQYALVGFALAVFYLILLSLSEHIGFGLAYASATILCVGLIGVYLTGVLASGRQVVSYCISLVTLYGMLFVILRSEDFALLMGSFLIFLTLAAVMLITRKVNWYGIASILPTSDKNTDSP